MDEYQKKVKDFHEKHEQKISHRPSVVDDDVLMLRYKLIREECSELLSAILMGDIEEAADGMADLIYVVEGTAVSLGIDLEEVFNVVHKNNMLKPTQKREDGKIVKPEDHNTPSISEVLERQVREGIDYGDN